MFPRTGTPNFTIGGASFGLRRRIGNSTRTTQATKAAPASRAVHDISPIASIVSLGLNPVQ